MAGVFIELRVMMTGLFKNGASLSGGQGSPFMRRVGEFVVLVQRERVWDSMYRWNDVPGGPLELT
jgi:hypothetical protein